MTTLVVEAKTMQASRVRPRWFHDTRRTKLYNGDFDMAMVVTEPCVNCKDKSCTKVCPVECFHEGPDMLVIDPDECIDCGACVPECPVEAIFYQDDVPKEWVHYIQLNRERTKIYPSAY